MRSSLPSLSADAIVPSFQGHGWVAATFPTTTEDWPRRGALHVGASGDDVEMSAEEVSRYVSDKPWVWPTETINFLCDIHADADALLASLVATGCVARTGPEDG